ncbi:MAG: GAF domain-containing protein [Pantanalinema sp. GBBB05]|nr:GAF domain-containing protein [Pantanalinema sp. GBBB05]
MLLPTSSEFVALCRAQVNLLTQGLGASFSAIYLTSDLIEDAQSRLVPIVTYPEAAVHWEADWVLSRLSAAPTITSTTPQLPADAASADVALPAKPVTSSDYPGITAPSQLLQSAELPALMATQRQIVLPLLHDEAMLGLLVTGRNDRAWSSWEQSQIRQIANTLALACVLDQRYQWLERDRQQQQLFQEQQHDMMDNLLHQFRNSLMALQTFGKLILKRLLPEDANRDIANSIVREATRLRELSQQIELLSGSQAAPLLPSVTTAETQDRAAEVPGVPLTPSLLAGSSFTLEPCAVEEILKPLLASATTIAQDQELILQASIPSDLPLVWASPQALREVLNNLIENALKYTPRGGSVLVTVAALPSQSWLEIAVTDTGCGIPAKDLPHIFQRHYRGVQAQTDIPGSGLGLAIAQTLVEQMHGEIQVFSPARASHLIPRTAISPPANQGAGTTLIVRLAIVPPSEASPAKIQAAP